MRVTVLKAHPAKRRAPVDPMNLPAANLPAKAVPILIPPAVRVQMGKA